MLQRRRSLLVTLASATILAGLALAYRWPWPAERGELANGNDLAAVRQRVEALEQEAQLARAGLPHDYRPQVQGSIADLHSPAAETSASSPA
jgi:hypothetical protein